MSETGHIFISYARRDGQPFVERLEASLQARGYTTWRDIRGIDPAKDFTAEIERAIKSADVVVTGITPDTERDDSFVRREIQYALVVGKRVIVARMAEIAPPIHVVNNTWVEFWRDWDKGFEHLITVLNTPVENYRTPTLPPVTADPFRLYVQTLYERTVDFLDRAVIRLIDLSSEETPEAVNAPPRQPSMIDLFFTAQGMGEEKQTKRPPFSTFAEAFNAYDGRVLLLGEPGAGKTITLMAFTRDAAAKRLSDPTAPLPVLGLISSWNAEKQAPLAEWLASGGGGVTLERVKGEIEQGKTLLLLDGLDELGREQEEHNPRSSHVSESAASSVRRSSLTLRGEGEQKLYEPRNQFIEQLPANNHILVTCRVIDYEAIGQKIALNGAVTLSPLDEGQMQSYLAEQPELWAAVQADEKLKEMLTTPLLLSFFAFAYRDDLDGTERQQLATFSNSPGDLRDKIFETYVQKRYEHELRKFRARLRFTLKEIYDHIGQIAAIDLINSLNNNFTKFHIANIGDTDFVDNLLDLAQKFHLVVTRGNGNYRFIHLLLRDYFAVHFVEETIVKEETLQSWNAHGDVFRELGQLEIALKSYEKATQLDNSATHPWIMIGWIKAELNRMDEALVAYDRALALQNDNALAWARKGRALRLMERYQDALACYDRALQIYPRYAFAWKGKGVVLERLGRMEEALECYQKASEIEPNEVWNWYNQADVMQSLARYDEAIPLLERALEIDPTHPNSWAKLGQIFRMQQRYDDALSAYDHAIDHEPEYAWAWNGRGLVLKILRRYADALVSFRKATQFQPNEVWHWYNLTEVLVELRQYADALGPATQATRADAGHAFSWAKLGQVLRHLNRNAEALNAYEKAIELQPDYGWALNGKGILLEHMGRLADALACYQQAALISDDYLWHCWYNQGNVLVLMERYDEAIPLLQKVIEVMPGHSQSWARMGSAYRHLGRAEDALKAYQQATLLDPKYIWAWNELGTALEQMGRLEEAEIAYRNAGNINQEFDDGEV